MEIKPPVAIAIIVVVLLVVGFFIYRGTGSGGRFKPPPPISSGLPSGVNTMDPTAGGGSTGAPAQGTSK